MNENAIAVRQLPLDLFRNDAATFEAFVAGPNGEAVSALRRAADGFSPGALYLWGAPATGRTHLLQAVCNQAAVHSRRPVYLPLHEARQLSPALCDGLEAMDLVCVDDLEAIAGQAAWEQSLLHLYNRLGDRRQSLIMTATSPPRESPIQLPDLRSRLAWAGVFQLKSLTDVEKRQVLVERVRARGLQMEEEVADLLLKRARRDIRALCELIDALDRASLATQRRLTAPFVRSFLGTEPHRK